MSQDPKDFHPQTEQRSSSQNRSNRGAYVLGALSAFALLGVAFAGISIYQSSTRQSTNAVVSSESPVPMTAAPASPTETTAPSASPAPVTAAPTAPTTSSSPAPVPSAPASPAPVAPSAPVPVTSTASYQTQGTQDGTPFTARVLELKRASGDSVLLRLAVTNAGQQNIRFSFLNVTPNESIYIVDAQEQKKAYPLKDASGKALATDGLALSNLEPEETIEVFAQFPAPAATTQQLSIYFPGASAPIADVPIAQ